MVSGLWATSPAKEAVLTTYPLPLASAVARPMPLAPPVITATAPSRIMTILIVAGRHVRPAVSRRESSRESARYLQLHWPGPDRLYSQAAACALAVGSKTERLCC